MSDTFEKENRATPTATLEQQILDPNHPKNDREWWAADEITRLTAENEKLLAALNLYREAVRIDVTMEGPRFMGLNGSALKRAWDADRATLEGKQ